MLVVEDTPEHAAMLCSDIQCLATLCNLMLPPIDHFPPPSSPEQVGERARIVSRLASGETTILITSADAVITGFSSAMPESMDIFLYLPIWNSWSFWTVTYKITIVKFLFAYLPRNSEQ